MVQTLRVRRGLGVLPGLLAEPAGPRWLVACLSAFRLERCGWGADDQVALVEPQHGVLRVVSCTPAAAEAGVVAGMRASEARALVAGLALEPRDEVQEAADHLALARAMEPVCDRARPWGPVADGVGLGALAVALEISAVTRWHGDEAAVMAAARARLAALGHDARVAVSSDPWGAAAVAWASPPGEGWPASSGVVATAAGLRVLPGAQAAALAELPVALLGPSEELARALTTLGVRRVGQLAALDPASLTGRFGEEGARLWAVARGRPGPAWTAAREAGPVAPVHVRLPDEAEEIRAIRVGVGEALARLVRVLEARGEAIVRLEAVLHLARGPVARLGLRLSRPSRDVAQVEALLVARMERTRLAAPVEAVTLHTLEVAPEVAVQADLLDRRQGREPLDALLTRLGDVLGDAALCQPVPVASWQPEAAWRPGPVWKEAPPAEATSAAPELGDDPVAWQEAAAWTAPRPRPTLLRRVPLPIALRVEGGRPVAIRGRPDESAREAVAHDGARWRPIHRARGPERLEGAWWTSNSAFARDYWVLGLEEGTAWAFEERGQWFLHGWFD
jgi:protein ImuB